MIYFVNDNNESIPYDGDFGFTKKAASFLNFKIAGDVSINFKLENNSETRRILGYNGFNQVGNPAYSKIPFKLTKNGSVKSRGYIVIQKDTVKELECFFVSGNANWFNLLQENILNYDMESYLQKWDNTAIENRRTRSDGIVFPLIDWMYSGKKWSGMYVVDYYANDTLDINTYFSDFYPCFHLSSLVKEVFKSANIIVDNELEDDYIYQNILITPDSPELSNQDQFIAKRSVFVARNVIQSIPGTAFTTTRINFNLVLSDSERIKWDQTNYQYKADTFFSADFELILSFSVNQSYTITVSVNGASTSTITFSSNELNYTGRVTLSPNDIVYVQIVTSVAISNFDVSGSFKVYPSERLQVGVDYIRPNNFLPSMKGVDVIKFIANYFRCIVTYDIESNKITITKFNSLRKDNALDFSKYFLRGEINYSLVSATNNYIRFPEVDDAQISEYNKGSNVKYGDYNIVTDFEIEDSKELYELPFGPAYDIKNIVYYNNLMMPYIQMIDLEDGDLYECNITSSGGFIRLTPIAGTFDPEPPEKCIIRIIDDMGQANGYHSVSSASTTVVDLYSPPIPAVTSTGRFYVQKASFNNAGSRIVISSPAIIGEFGAPAAGFHRVYSSGLSTTQYFTYRAAWFYKPKINVFTADNIVSSVSMGEINIPGSNHDKTISDLYFEKTDNVFRNPPVRAFMRLPESVFYNIDHRTLVYLNTEKFRGYFYIDSVANYKDSVTPVEVNLLCVD